MKTYSIDIDFYSIEFNIKAKNKTEARKKVKAKIKKGLALKHINHLYIDEA